MDCSILMPAYNHEAYIAQALDSALSQITDFSYEILINDDCSTDRTREIIEDYKQKYSHKIRTVYAEKNQGLLLSYKKLLSIATGTYIAILESDDFWNSKENLQKKLSYLMNNPDCSLIASETNLVDGENVFLHLSSANFRSHADWYTDLLYHNPLKAVSVIFKRISFEKYCNIDDYIAGKFRTFDYPVWLSISAHEKCKFIKEPLCSYRILDTSISNNKDYKKRKDFAESMLSIREFCIAMYPPKDDDYSHEKILDEYNYTLMNLALNHHKFFDYYKHAKKISINHEKKTNCFVAKYFTFIFYVIFQIRAFLFK